MVCVYYCRTYLRSFTKIGKSRGFVYDQIIIIIRSLFAQGIRHGRALVLMPAEKRPFEQDEAGAALEPATRPCSGAMSSGKVESLSPPCRGPAISLRSLSLIARVAHAKQKASMLHSACAHSRVS
jgi:hypothetical protein